MTVLLEEMLTVEFPVSVALRIMTPGLGDDTAAAKASRLVTIFLSPPQPPSVLSSREHPSGEVVPEPTKQPSNPTPPGFPPGGEFYYWKEHSRAHD
jgi:hypothetical protein